MFVFSNLLNSSDNSKHQEEERQPRRVYEAAPIITLNLPTPTEIYSTILGEVDNLFSKITGGHHESEQVNEAKKQCHELLSQIQNKVRKKVMEGGFNSEVQHRVESS